jgi:hypothetical protein
MLVVAQGLAHPELPVPGSTVGSLSKKTLNDAQPLTALHFAAQASASYDFK